MKKVITYGTFDLLHYGHINLLKKAKEYGDYLIVALSSDVFNKKKGKESYFNFEERREMLLAIKYVDEIILEDSWKQKIEDVTNKNVDVFVIGDDWSGKFDFLMEYCKVVYIERTKEISTTKIKNDLKLKNR